MMQSYCYCPEVDYIPIIYPYQVFYSFYTTALFPEDFPTVEDLLNVTNHRRWRRLQTKKKVLTENKSELAFKCLAIRDHFETLVEKKC